MGKRWPEYRVGAYRLRQLNGEACAVWYEDGKRRRYRLGVKGYDEGRIALDRFARRQVVFQAASAQTVGELWERYIADRELDGKGMDVFKHNWKALAPWFSDISPEEINADYCRAYARERFALGRAQATVWTELARLRSCLQWAFKKGLITRLPDVWTPSSGEARDRVLTEEEVWRLLDACVSPHVRLFVLLAIASAGRHTAILELTWDRVDFENGLIDLRKKITRDPMSKRGQKGRAVVPMNNLLRAALSEARSGALTDHVIEWDGKPLKSIKKAFRAAVVRAGLSKDVTPHILRHTAATWLTESDVPLEQVARYLGHRHVTTTEAIYSKPRVHYLRAASDAVEKMVRKGRT